MNDTTHQNRRHLRIWQENLNKSMNANLDLINHPRLHLDWDLILIQEPYLDFLNNTRASHNWRVVYPTNHGSSPQHTRSVILVNSRLSTNDWRQLDFPHPDVTVLHLSGAIGTLTIFNIYNADDNDDTLHLLARYCHHDLQRLCPNHAGQLMWAGDFNRKHPAWELQANSRCFTTSALQRAQVLIDYVADFDLFMALPTGIATLKHKCWKGEYRPDNVFLASDLQENLISCKANRSLTPAGTDHYPILTVLEFTVTTHTPEQRRNFHNVDWKKFRAELQSQLTTLGPACRIRTIEDFQAKADGLHTALANTIERVVPLLKPSPYMKRWWTPELAAKRKVKRKLADEAYRFRYVDDHPSHEAARRAEQDFCKAIQSQRTGRWREWIGELEGQEVWKAKNFISGPATDGGRTRIPSLKTRDLDGQVIDEASTNDDKSARLANCFFPTPPARTLAEPDVQYPPPVSRYRPITRARIKRAISSLAHHKAPGPDGIKNIVLVRCADILLDYLYYLFSAVFDLKTYYSVWREWHTVVLRKPGRADYSQPKSYRPIALYSTVGKLLTKVVTEDIAYISERYGALPLKHFGGRPGRTTTDSLFLVTQRIKDAWRVGKVASVLFLDIEGAFPNVVAERLLHNMRMRGIPEEYVQFVDRMLTDRRTKLKFDDYESFWTYIINGLGQGDPLSMIVFQFYNAPLLDIPQDRTEDAVAFADDTALIAIGRNFQETNAKLKDMMERPGGGFDWAAAHHSKFEVSKFGLIHFSRARVPETDPLARRKTKPTPRPPLELRGIVIKPRVTHKFLGLILDQELRWKAQKDYAVGKGIAYTFQLRRLAKTNYGLPLAGVTHLYQGVSVRQTLYGAAVWYTPVHHRVGSKARKGSVEATKRIATVQRAAATSITGGLRSTATDVLDAHAGLLPVHHLLDLECYREALRLATLPTTHPLAPHIRRTSRRYVKRHRSALHHLFHIFDIRPDRMEKIDTVGPQPNWKPVFTTSIAQDKKQALREEEECTGEPLRVYTDGSGYEGQIGASAVLIRSDRAPSSLRYHLGTDKQQIVFGGEGVGVLLGLELLRLEKTLRRVKHVQISLDNQPVIQALQNPKPRAGNYIIKLIRSTARRLLNAHKHLRLTIRWTPGHSDVEGNEYADRQAKDAATGNSSPTNRLPQVLRRKPLPFSKSALKQEHQAKLKSLWEAEWSKSPRYAKFASLDKKLLSGSFRKLAKTLTRPQTSIIMQLRTGHIPLNGYLHRIRKAESPDCPHCPGIAETVQHYLLECNAYERPRHALRRTLGRTANDLSTLLCDRVRETLKYVHHTKRFKNIYGEVLFPRDGSGNS